jgi:hypothetical protein
MRPVQYTLKFWLPLAAALTIICALVYIAVQQNLRLGLNEPQVQMAEDAARALASGQSASAVIPASAPRVDIAQSLAAYLIVFDSKGVPIASGATLNGSIPVPPAGVFDYARHHADDRVSWQPEPGVRSAVVIVAVNGGVDGFVLAGRGMREVENQENALTNLVALAWICGMVVTLILVAFFELLPFTRAGK